MHCQDFEFRLNTLHLAVEGIAFAQPFYDPKSNFFAALDFFIRNNKKTLPPPKESEGSTIRAIKKIYASILHGFFEILAGQ